MLRGEERVHVGGAGGGDAAADGAEPPAHVADADRHPESQHVPPAGRLRHEHPVPPHRQAGGLAETTSVLEGFRIVIIIDKNKILIMLIKDYDIDII